MALKRWIFWVPGLGEMRAYSFVVVAASAATRTDGAICRTRPVQPGLGTSKGRPGSEGTDGALSSRVQSYGGALHHCAPAAKRESKWQLRFTHLHILV